MTACAAVLVLAWLVSNHYPPWLTFHSDILAAVAACLLAVAGLGSFRRSRIAIPGPAVFFAALACIPAAQVATGLIVFAGDGWIVALYLLCAAWTVVWSARLSVSSQVEWAVGLATALLAGALANCYIAMLQRWDVDAGFLTLHIVAIRPGYAPFGNLAQPNQLASLIGRGLAALMLLYERSRVSAAWALAAAALLTFTLVVTQSRAALPMFVAAILCHAWLRPRIGLRTPTAIVAGVAAVWGILYFAWFRALDSMGMPALASLESRLQPGPRASIWAQLWDAIWLRPWSGFGWNQVSEASIATAASQAHPRATEHSHNLLLDLILWNGLPLAALIVAIALWWLIRAAPRVRSANGAFGLLVVLLLVMHSMLEFPLDYLYFLVPFAAAVGIVAADGGRRETPTLPRATGFVGVGVFVALIGWIVADYARVEENFRDMRFAVARYGRPMPAEPPPLLQTQFTQLAAFHRLMLSTPHPGMTRAEVDWTRDVAHRYAYAPSLYRYALVQALNGQMDGAAATLAQLRQLYGAKMYESAKDEITELARGRYPALRELHLP